MRGNSSYVYRGFLFFCFFNGMSTDNLRAENERPWAHDIGFKNNNNITIARACVCVCVCVCRWFYYIIIKNIKKKPKNSPAHEYTRKRQPYDDDDD